VDVVPAAAVKSALEKAVGEPLLPSVPPARVMGLV
jgi:hypothetical protein